MRFDKTGGVDAGSPNVPNCMTHFELDDEGGGMRGMHDNGD